MRVKVLSALVAAGVALLPRPIAAQDAARGAASQSPAAQSSVGEVVVTAQRPLVLTVDFNEIWRKCLACRMEQTRVRAGARPLPRGDAPIGSIQSMPNDLQQQSDLANGGGAATVGYWREAARPTIVSRNFGPSQKQLRAANAHMLAATEAFRTQLGARVAELAEAQRISNGATAIQRARDPLPPGARRLDITAQLIAALDREAIAEVTADGAPVSGAGDGGTAPVPPPRR